MKDVSNIFKLPPNELETKKCSLDVLWNDTAPDRQTNCRLYYKTTIKGYKMPTVKKIFTEYGLDFDNNKYGFGRSTEYEYTDGTELRTHEPVKFKKVHARYFRIWIGKIVFVIDSDRPRFSLRKKKRWNFKIVYGKSGI